MLKNVLLLLAVLLLVADASHNAITEPARARTLRKVTPTRKTNKKLTKKPTKYPTKYPTKKPRKKPTKKPMKKPTKKPRKKRTKKPRKKPTKKPTRKPTKKTKRPAKKPTNMPSAPITPTTAPSPCKTDGTLVKDILDLADARIRESIDQSTEGLAATYLRLGFHDCVPNGEAGGCDGCVNLSNPANKGLRVAVDALTPIVAELEDDCLGVSRADLWAFAALVAADVSQNNLIFSDTFKVGRENCETVGTCINDENSCATNGPDQTSDHPSNDFTTHQLIAFMNAHFGFDARETVALMGVHTLGRALPENSGFEGGSGWVVNNTHLGKFLRLSTRYYVLLDF